MGERVRVDDRWRVVIPRRLREGIRPGDELVAERVGNAIVLRVAAREDLVREFEEVKLYAGERAEWDAEVGKHRYGGVRE